MALRRKGNRTAAELEAAEQTIAEHRRAIERLQAEVPRLEQEREAIADAEFAGEITSDEARERVAKVQAEAAERDADESRIGSLLVRHEQRLVELGRLRLGEELEQAQRAEAGTLRTRNEASGAFGAASSSLEALMSTLEAARGETEAAGARTRAAERALAEAGGEVPDDPDWLARERDEPDWASRRMSRRELEEFTERLGKVMRTGPTRPAALVEERRAAAERSREEVIRQAVMNLRDIPANPGGELAEYRADVLARLPDAEARAEAERRADVEHAAASARRDRSLREQRANG